MSVSIYSCKTELIEKKTQPESILEPQESINYTLQELGEIARAPFALELWMYAELITCLKAKASRWVENKNCSTTVQSIFLNMAQYLKNNRVFEGALGRVLFGKKDGSDWYRKAACKSFFKFHNLFYQMRSNQDADSDTGFLYRINCSSNGRKINFLLLQTKDKYQILEHHFNDYLPFSFPKKLISLSELKKWLLPFNIPFFFADYKRFSFAAASCEIEKAKADFIREKNSERIFLTPYSCFPVGFNTCANVRFLIERPLKIFDSESGLGSHLLTLLGSVDTACLEPELYLFDRGFKLLSLTENRNPNDIDHILTIPSTLISHCKINTLAISSLFLGPAKVIDNFVHEITNYRTFSRALELGEANLLKGGDLDQYNLFTLRLNSCCLASKVATEIFGGHFFIVLQFARFNENKNEVEPVYRLYNSFLATAHPAGRETAVPYWNRTFTKEQFNFYFMRRFERITGSKEWTPSVNRAFKDLFGSYQSSLIKFQFLYDSVPLSFIELSGNAKDNLTLEQADFERKYPEVKVRLASCESFQAISKGLAAFRVIFKPTPHLERKLIE